MLPYCNPSKVCTTEGRFPAEVAAVSPEIDGEISEKQDVDDRNKSGHFEPARLSDHDAAGPPPRLRALIQPGFVDRFQDQRPGRQWAHAQAAPTVAGPRPRIQSSNLRTGRTQRRTEVVCFAKSTISVGGAVDAHPAFDLGIDQDAPRFADRTLPHPADVGPLAESYLTKLAERRIVFQGHLHLASPGGSRVAMEFR